MQVEWQGLLETSSVLSLFLVVWWALERWIPPLKTFIGKMTFGALLGLTTVLGMAMSLDILPGFTFDLRHAFIAASGLFGGPVSALTTAAFAVVYRLDLGGAAALAGVFGICMSATIGSLAYFVISSEQRTLVRFLVFAAGVTAGVFASFFAIGEEMRFDLLRSIGVPVLTLNFLTTLATVLLINMYLARGEAIHLNEIYAAITQELPDCLNAKDLDGNFIAANEATARLMRAKNAAELIGRSDFDYYPKDLAEQYHRDEMAVMRSGKPSVIEQRVKFYSGEAGWLSTIKVPMRNKRGEVIGLITHNRDITELKNTQHEFRLSQSLSACNEHRKQIDRIAVRERPAPVFSLARDRENGR